MYRCFYCDRITSRDDRIIVDLRTGKLLCHDCYQHDHAGA